MIHEVKIYGPGGELKEVIAGADVSKAFWKRFGTGDEPVLKKAKVKQPKTKPCLVCKIDFPCFHGKKTICSPECYKTRQEGFQKARAEDYRERVNALKRDRVHAEIPVVERPNKFGTSLQDLKEGRPSHG